MCIYDISSPRVKQSLIAMLLLIVACQSRAAALVFLSRHKGKSHTELRTHRRSKFRMPRHSGSTVITVRWIMHSINCYHSQINPLNPELNPICYLLALLAHHLLHVSRIRVKSLTLRLLMLYIYIYIWSAYS